MAAALFDCTCRTCNNETTNLLNIFESKIGTESPELIVDVLNQCGPPKLIEKGDEYPEHICQSCVEKLKATHRFLKSWHQSESEFEVALKFEKRRKRLKIEQPEEPNTAIVSMENQQTTPIESVTSKSEEMVSSQLENAKTDEGTDANAELKKTEVPRSASPPTCSYRDVGETKDETKEETKDETKDDALNCAKCKRLFNTVRAFHLHQTLLHRN